MNLQRALRTIFLLLSGGLALVALILSIATALFVGRAQSTVGMVVDFARVEGAAPFLAVAPEDGVLYYPIVRYKDPIDGWTRFTALAGAYRRSYRLNDTVGVLYLPAQPERSMVDDFWSVWGRSIIFAGLASLFSLAGVLAPYGFRMGQDGKT